MHRLPLMQFEEKVTAARELLASKGIVRAAYAPTIVTLLWRAGVKVPPPHFAGFLGTFLFSTVFFGVLWGVIMWFLVWSRNATPPATAAGTSVLVGVAVGLVVALYYRFSARRHAIPKWSEFEPAPAATRI
jgi:hypothetical protein